MINEEQLLSLSFVHLLPSSVSYQFCYGMKGKNLESEDSDIQIPSLTEISRFSHDPHLSLL